VKRSVWLGRVALTSQDGPSNAPGREACGAYADHYLPDGS
jgi:hypothetical protein